MTLLPVSRTRVYDMRNPEACSKATSFLVLCDSFNVPLVFIADQPGFLIGRDGERKGATGRVMNWMN